MPVRGLSLSTREYIESILGKVNWDFSKASAGAFAPSNIALSKYWGKRDKALNLPFTDSVSISLGNLGAVTNVKNTQEDNDVVFLNDIEVDRNNSFYIRLVKFLDLCRPGDDFKFSIDTVSNIPVGAGIASSACGFAALTKALNEFFSWGLSNEKLSMLARLGSGSAARSMWDGFVYWHAGNSNDGKDCYAELMPYEWPEIRVGLILIETGPKIISSTDAMNRCVATSKFYSDWPKVCNVVLREVCSAIESKDFEGRYRVNTLQCKLLTKPDMYIHNMQNHKHCLSILPLHTIAFYALVSFLTLTFPSPRPPPSRGS